MKKIITIIILLGAWAFLTAIYMLQSESITGISDRLDENVFINKPTSEFVKGRKIKMDFTARENYLGQVAVRFYNYERINSDEVIFRLKEKNTSGWYYENIYKTDQFQPHGLFPFGFPIIENSKNKNYVVEIESVKGKVEDAVTLSSEKPLSTVTYQYPKQKMLSNSGLMSEFVVNKFEYTEYNRDFLFMFGIYVNFIFLSLVLLYLVIQYIFFNTHTVLRLGSANIIVVGLIALVFSAVALYVNKTELSDKIAVVGYFLLVIGVLKLLWEVMVTKPEVTTVKRNKQNKRTKRK